MAFLANCFRYDVRAFIDEYFKAWEGTDGNGFCPTMLKPCRWRSGHAH